MNLHLVSKGLQICQMTTMDCWWKSFYHSKMALFRDSSRTKGQTIMMKMRTIETATHDFRKHLIEASKVYNVKPLKCRYYCKREIMKFNLNQLMESSTSTKIEVVVAGNGASGKTWLLMRFSSWI